MLNLYDLGVGRIGGLGGFGGIDFPAANMAPEFTTAPSAERAGGALNPAFPTPAAGGPMAGAGPPITQALPPAVAIALGSGGPAATPVVPTSAMLRMNAPSPFYTGYGPQGFGQPSTAIGGLSGIGNYFEGGSSFGPGVLGELGLFSAGAGGFGTKPRLL